MINKFTGIRIASQTTARNVPLPVGQHPTEYTRKHGIAHATPANAGMALVKAMRDKWYKRA